MCRPPGRRKGAARSNDLSGGVWGRPPDGVDGLGVQPASGGCRVRPYCPSTVPRTRSPRPPSCCRSYAVVTSREANQGIGTQDGETTCAPNGQQPVRRCHRLHLLSAGPCRHWLSAGRVDRSLSACPFPLSTNRFEIGHREHRWHLSNTRATDCSKQLNPSPHRPEVDGDRHRPRSLL